jgi:hypothetical protein
MVRAFFVAIALALGVTPEPAPRPEPRATPVPGDILAVFFQEVGPGGALARVDPLTLKPSGPRLRLATGGGWATAFSPDKRALALSGGMGLAKVELVDVRRMRSLGVVDLSMSGSITLLSWQRGALFAVVDDHQRRAVFTIEPRTRRVENRHRIDGAILQAKRTDGYVVLLVGPRTGIGPLRLTVVGRKGTISTPLSGFAGGSSTERQGEDIRTREEIPALVIDEVGRRAFVTTGRTVAEVSLDDLSMTTHILSEPVSLLERFRNWVEPPAYAKLVDGYWRNGVWVGDGLFAVTGMDYSMSSGVDGAQRPFGLAVIDTRDWSIRTVAEDAADFVVTEHAVLTYNYDSGDGVRGYDLGGDERFHLVPRASIFQLQVVGGLVYAHVEDGKRLAVIDSALRRKIGDARVRQPITLIGG